MARFDEETLRQVRERTDLVSLVSETVRLRKSGRRYVGLCPFHDEHTPSFGITPELGLFHCFGCGAGGDAIEFLRTRDGLEFADAVRALARRAGIVLPEDPTEEAGARAERTHRERLERALSEAASFYRAELWSGSRLGREARAYLERRGIGRPTLDAFGVGVAPRTGLLAHLTEQGLDTNLLEQAGIVCTADGADRLALRIVLPIRDESGHLVGFGGRLLGEASDRRPKYLNSPETRLFAKRRLLYGLDRARPAMRQRGEALLVEGYFDVLACHQADIRQAVASLGTSLTREGVELLRRFTDRLVVAYDTDRAGEEAARKALRLCDLGALPARAAWLPAGKDPAEFLASVDTAGAPSPRTAFLAAIRGARAHAMFVLERGLASDRAGTPEGRAEIARDVLDAIAASESPVTRAAYLRETAQRLGLPEEALWREIRRPSQGAAAGRPQNPTSVETHRAEKIWHAKASNLEMARHRREEELAAIILNVPRVGRDLGLTEETFVDPVLARFVQTALAESDASFEEDLENRRQALLTRGRTYDEPDKAARDLYAGIQTDRDRARRRAQVEKLRQLEQQGTDIPAATFDAALKQARREVHTDEG